MEECQRVLGLSIDAHLKVQVGTCCPACSPYLADGASPDHYVPHAYVNGAHVGIKGGISAAVVHNDINSVSDACFIAGIDKGHCPRLEATIVLP